MSKLRIMNLLLLALDIQAQILFLPKATKSRINIGEREIRSIAATINWKQQQKIWGKLLLM